MFNANWFLLSLPFAIFVAQSGCKQDRPMPEIVSKQARVHFVHGEPVVGIKPFATRDGIIVGALVMVDSYESNMRKVEQLELPKEARTPDVSKPPMQVVAENGESSIVIGEYRRKLDAQEFSDGPWIYYLNEDQPFRRIAVSSQKLREFEVALAHQHPLEFVAQWCDDQPGELLADRFASSPDSQVPVSRR